MNLIRNTVLLCVVLCVPVNAQSRVEMPEMPESLTLSHVDHPVANQLLLPLFTKVYGELGINVEFVVQPSMRNMYLASAGITDGDLAYSDLLTRQHKNLLRVGKSLFDSQFILLCHKNVACNQDVIADESKTVLMTDSSLGGMKLMYSDRLKANIYSVNNLSSIPKIVETGRVLYGIYITTSLNTNTDYLNNLNSVVMFATPTHHVLNEKYASLIPLIAPKLDSLTQQMLYGK